MKKILSLFAIALMGVSLFTACSDDDNNPTDSSVQTDFSNGIFIVNSGNQSKNIDGTLTFIDNNTGNTLQKCFQTVNGRSLGLTVEDAVTYGDKMYIVVTQENTVEVVDSKTLKSIKQLKTTDLMGAEKGSKPRNIVAYKGKVYVSTYATATTSQEDGSVKGCVAAIDTTDFSTTTYEVGAYPEGMAVNNGKLYVANSSYGNGKAPSISEIDLASGTVNEIKDPLITNPVSITAVNGVLYILDSGLYDASWNQSGQGVRTYSNGKFAKLADATAMAVNADATKIYLINNPYTNPATAITYSVYDTKTGKTSRFIDGSNVYSPTGISVDPKTGHIYIISYNEDPDTKKAAYSLPGYVNEYDSNGSFIKKYDTGVGPNAIKFTSANAK